MQISLELNICPAMERSCESLTHVKATFRPYASCIMGCTAFRGMSFRPGV